MEQRSARGSRRVSAAVVVKVLAANLVGDAETSARFDREAQRLRGVQHPNIVTMVDYGHAQGSAFLVMEYLQGELLSAYLQRKGRLTLVDFAPIVRPCRGRARHHLGADRRDGQLSVARADPR